MKSSVDSTFPRPAGSSCDVAAVIVCAGKGERTGLAYNKILYHIGRKTVIETVLDSFKKSVVGRIVLVVAQNDRDEISELVQDYPDVSICTGGATRTESVRNGLNAVGHCDIVVIHDGARPFVKPETIDASVASAIEYGSGIATVPAVDTIRQIADDGASHTLPRDTLFNVQTPQTFRYAQIKGAYDGVDGVFTDDAEIYERAGFVPRMVDGAYDNVKITTAQDLVKRLPDGMRIGIGFDVHRLTEGRPLILGGVNIPYERGLLGHSDADVLTHAIMDALLSAAGLPDIGVLFPDDAPELEGISSLILLDRVALRVAQSGKTIVDISAVVMAQKPKLAAHIEDIRATLAARLGIETGAVNVSATTTEMLGIIGKGDAIAASAACLLTESYD